MKHIRIGLLIAAGLAAITLPSAASARPHHGHHRGHSSVRLAYGYSPYAYGRSAYGYSPYNYGSAYGYSPYRYGVSRHQRHHIRDQIHGQQDHIYGVHNHH